MSAKPDRAGLVTVKTLMHALEPRIMFDGAGLATGLDLAHGDDAGHAIGADTPEMAAVHALPAVSPTNEIVFVDTRVPDYQAIVSTIGANVEVVLLDTGRDGIGQIAEALEGRSGVDAIHLISHGEQGLLALGNGTLHSGNLDNYSDALSVIGAALNVDGDILLYGCDVAGGEKGADFMARLADLTGADIAASDDLTGDAAKGGDWTLEASTGIIETAGLSLANYSHVLANGTLTFTSDTGLADGVATDGEGGSVNLSGIDIEIRNISDINGTPLGDLQWRDNSFLASSDPTYSGLTLDDGANGVAKGMSISSADGSEFQLDGFRYYDWGATQSSTVTVKGYRDGVEVASMTFEGWTGQDNVYEPLDVSFDDSFNNVDDVRLFISAGGWVGDQSGTNHTINDIVIADAVVPATPVTLAQGDIVVGGMNATTDTINLVTTAEIAAGTVIYITDKGWDQATDAFTALNTGDGVITWTVSSTISAGTVLQLYLAGSDGTTTLTNITTGSDLTANIAVSGYSVTDPLGIAGDQIFIYQGEAANPFFISGFNNSSGVVDAANWNTSVGATLRDSMLPDGTGSQNALTNGASALGVPGGGSQQDNVFYNGPTSATDRATWLSRLLNVANWSGDNTGAGNPSFGLTTGSDIDFAAPNPAPVIDANGAGGGTANTTTFTENGGAIRIVTSDASLSDDDNITGMTLVLGATPNGASESISYNSALNGGVALTAVGLSGNYDSATRTYTLSGTASGAVYQNVLRALTYNNISGGPDTAARTVTITATDAEGAAGQATATINITAVNDAPTLSATAGNPTFIENGSAVDLFSEVSVSTVESGQSIVGLTLTVSNLVNGADEVLTIDGTAIALTTGTSGTTSGNALNYSVSVSSGTATVTLGTGAGINTAAAQTLVDGIAYRNASEAPTGASRVVTLTSIMDDGGTANGGVNATSLAIAATVSVVAVNDAPTLSGGPYALTGTNEDTVSSGTLVSAILAGLSHNDVDGSGTGIAITAAAGNGTWQYSTDGGTWNGVGSVSGAAALLLSASTQLRYVPDGANGESVSLTFRAWDQTSGMASTNSVRSTMDTSTTGGSTSVSTGTAQAQLVVSAVNDAPILTPAAPALPGLTDTDINNAGRTVAAIVGASISDVDAGALQGIAITGLSSGNGTWQYSLDGGTSWTGMGAVAGSSALLLRATDLVRFVPDGVSGTTGSLTYRAWDQTGATAGQQGTKVDATTTGGTGSFSSAIDTASIIVTAVNDAPTITAPGSISITEDLAGTLTGISFADSDSGSGIVTATFSVPSGTLSATSVAGVTVGGTASALTLTGTIADINAFIAASGVNFTTAADATASVTLTISVNDNGNTGSGGAQVDTTTVTLTVTAVNDAPVNGVPGAQSVDQDGALVFSAGNGNQISISDVDAGGGNVQVTLTASNGLLTLSGTTGLSFIVGSGAGNATMTFEGSIAEINAALSGLVFTPTAGYEGAASLQITTNDLGLSGSGGAQTDTDTIAINVDPANPKVTGVDVSTPDGSYKIGDTITVTMTFNQTVTVDTSSGVPILLLETGATDRAASYVSGSGSNTLTFVYTVQAGDVSSDLDYGSTGALALNGATIRGNGLDAVLTLPAPGSADSIAGQADIVIDGIVPVVSSVAVPANGTYVAGNHLDFTLNMSEAVTVNTAGGTPYLSVTLDTGGTIRADYIAGSGTSALTFRLTVANGQLDTNGISVGALSANGGTLSDSAGNSANLTLNNVGSTSNVLVDAVRPTATIDMADAAVGIGEVGQATITFNEAVTGLVLGDIVIENGVATSLTGGGTTWTVYFTPDAGTEDATNRITVDISNVVDAVGNTGSGTVQSDNYVVDTVRPTASIAISDTSLTAGETATVTITFSEAVSGLSAADFVVPNGSLSGFATADGGLTWTATLTPSVSVLASGNTIEFALTGITDLAGNSGAGTTLSPDYAVSTIIAAPPPPAPPIITPPSPPPVSPAEPAPPGPVSLPVGTYGPTPPPLTTVVPVLSSFASGFNPGGASSPFAAFQSQVMDLSIPSGASLQPGEAFSIGIIGDAEGVADMTFELRAADGSELPDWVNFDAASGTISGMVPEGFTGTVRVQIIITDDEGRTVIRVIELSANGSVATPEASIRSFSLPEIEGRQGLDDLLALQMGITAEQTSALLRGLTSIEAGRG
jgi:hypothetical protein